MELYHKRSIRQLSIIGLVLLLLITSLPAEAQAASRGKVTKKYKITFRNANSDTVINKGGKLKLKCTARTKSGKRGKIRYKSSDKRVISVSRKGVIKGRKKGKARITAYVKVKGKIRGRKTITIRVGKPVSSISITGHNYLRAGKTTMLKAEVSSEKATNKRVLWESSNPKVASVDANGIVTARGNGKTTITATAKDGSGIKASINVYSHKYTKTDTKWIAHRGLHKKEIENTAAAFEAAGRAGFWGCECDIYETKHVQKTVLDENGDPIKDENGEPVTEESFEIVIDHDGNFKRVFGVDAKPSDLTADEIRNNDKLKQVCFFDDYLSICNNKDRKMVPIIEIKNLSDQGLEKMIDMVNKEGLLSKDKSQFISFSPTMIEKAKGIAKREYNADIYTGYLMAGNNLEPLVETAKEKDFDGVNIYLFSLTDNINDMCNKYNLLLGTWTYGDGVGYYKDLYEHVVLHKFNIYTTTTDGKFF